MPDEKRLGGVAGEAVNHLDHTTSLDEHCSEERCQVNRLLLTVLSGSLDIRFSVRDLFFGGLFRGRDRRRGQACGVNVLSCLTYSVKLRWRSHDPVSLQL